jgi:hypothetical protein
MVVWVLTCIVPTGASLTLRHLTWLRRLTVLWLVLVGVFTMGSMHVTRLGADNYSVLFQSQVKYWDAYRAGLEFGQHVVNERLPLLLAVYACLAALALAPTRPDDKN